MKEIKGQAGMKWTGKNQVKGQQDKGTVAKRGRPDQTTRISPARLTC
jgi:hypothetical protein